MSFVDLMFDWVNQQPAIIQESIRPRQYSAIQRLGKATESGSIYFDPALIFREILDSKHHLWDSVVVPVTDFLNHHYDPLGEAKAFFSQKDEPGAPAPNASHLRRILTSGSQEEKEQVVSYTKSIVNDISSSPQTSQTFTTTQIESLITDALQHGTVDSTGTISYETTTTFPQLAQSGSFEDKTPAETMAWALNQIFNSGENLRHEESEDRDTSKFKPVPVELVPVKTEIIKPTTTEPALADPLPVDSVPVDSVPVESVLVESIKNERVPSEPMLAEPVQVGFTQVEPVHALQVLDESVSPETAPVSPSQLRQPEPLEWDFPSYDYNQPEVEGWGQVRVTRRDERLEYEWPREEGMVYRVVVSDYEEPFNPDDSEEIAVVETGAAIDRADLETPFRFVTVWAYPKPRDGSKYLQQGRKVARTLYVQPIEALNLTFSDGSILGKWPAVVSPPGSNVQVKVSRLPEGQSRAKYMGAQRWLAHPLPDRGFGFSGGFQDSDVFEGHTYSYVAAVCVEIDGLMEYSAPEVDSMTVVAETPHKVDDLEATPKQENTNLWSLEWTAPTTGEVLIFRTPTPPSPEAADKEFIAFERLEEAGLGENFLLQNPIGQAYEDVDGEQSLRSSMDSVAWLSGEEWDTVYLTPVTVIGTAAAIGRTITQVRTREIEGLTLVNRLQWQLVTFAWPGDAVSVNLHVTPLGQVEKSAVADRHIESKEYERNGGFVLDPPLPPEGATLHLVAVSHYAGVQIESQPSSIDVLPLWGYNYAIKPPILGKIGRFAGQKYASIDIQAVSGVCPPEALPAFVLVHNPNRLPLSWQDGEHIQVFRTKPSKQVQEQPVSWFYAPSEGDLSVYFDYGNKTGGYYRLMVYANPQSNQDADPNRSLERYALVDPSLDNLKVG